MRKALWASAVVLSLLLAYLTAAHLSGGAFFDFGLQLGSDRGWMRRTTLTFWEDIQFKDYARAATYHSPEKQAAVDISYLIYRLFGYKPEGLDFMGFEILMADVDSTGNRGRVKSRVKVKYLHDGSVRDHEIMLYYYRDGPRAPWYMKLEDSLRDIGADPNKQS